MSRGFKVIKEEFRKHENIQLPERADRRSAGYDFFSPEEIVIPPHTTKMLMTEVKAYMEEDEVLMLYVRSSIGIKQGLVLANGTGVIDSSYYENPSNDGNIGLALHNTTDKEVTIKAGERVAQGVFIKYLTADSDVCRSEERVGGFGSSGK